MPKTIGEKMPPEALKKWDRWDYRIYAPLSFDDEARLHVVLTNQDGSTQDVVFQIVHK